ncbi:acetylglutamate kinase [Candidatus Roizmanbacteria bacterium RIFCSPHIGHO2_01_FULL_39_8]|uniref:Acetylglutamate kinase n=2 Tax=Candidatus Roizmaniibacteriota TaxID=1752723 RepID=A0A1F7GMP0_9BACT|nr:MAG: acetylglutamate kinase [Candidatus Roizmanbacteria bacterium RIFCSPHIGHO2_01_FULL_39_8]OGK25217.1 MAG: acetylglutamate kinase [Candidatus Roizmanbacteria bacterium RIFCSPHIGHO2_02_FULL_39_9]
MILIKIGGGRKINWEYIAEDVAELVKKEKVIIVHGASGIRDEVAKELKAPTRTVVSPSGVSSVYTDQKALDIFLMAYAGLVNKKIVAALQKNGVNAVGLSGVDGRLWEGKRKSNLYVQEGNKTKLITDNLTGKVEKINTHLINLLIKNNYVPVICPPAISHNNEIINTDNDFAVAIMIKELGIKTLISLFEAPGMLEKARDEKSLISIIKRVQIDNYLQFAEGRMKKKLLGAKIAFENGVKIVYWGDGRIKHPIKSVLAGKGTIIN